MAMNMANDEWQMERKQENCEVLAGQDPSNRYWLLVNHRLMLK
jgi:hypothetical protein